MENEHASPAPVERQRTRRPGRLVAAHIDRAIADLAATQHGVITREQLVACGLTSRQVASRTNRTLWPRGADVFAVGHPGLSRTGRAYGALLLAGPGAGLSHTSAARLWGMTSRASTGPIHVSVLGGRKLVAPADVSIHRPPTLRAVDIVRHRGFDVVTPERTIVDMLPASSVAETSRMLEQMVTMLGRSPDGLHEWAGGVAGMPGLRKLVRALDDVAGPAVIRSEFEGLFRSMCQDGGLPQALTNHRIGSWEVDAVYPDHKVAVELDSWRWHGGRWQFHQDRRKGLDISRAGYELIRLTWPQLKHETATVIEALRYALSRGAGRT